MASYNPNYVSGFWHDPQNVTFGQILQCTPSPAQANKGIREATPTSLTIEMDLNADNTVGAAGEIIRYQYLTNFQAITREAPACLSSRDPALVSFLLGDDPTTGNPRTVRVINNDLNILNANGQVAIFRYYDAAGMGTEVFPNCLTGTETSCAEISKIRRIDICLAVQTDEIDPSTQQPRSLIYSTSVQVRNHGLGPEGA